MYGRLEDRQCNGGRVGLEEDSSDVCRFVYDVASRSSGRLGLGLDSELAFELIGWSDGWLLQAKFYPPQYK